MTTTISTRRASTALVTVAAAVALASCGSSANTSPSAQATSTTGKNRAELAGCLKKHGVNLPAGGQAPGAGAPPAGAPGGASPPGGAPSGGTPPPGVPGGGFPSGSPPNGFPGGSKFRAALKACGANLPSRPSGAGFSHQAIQKYVSCVNNHGYKLPQPNLSGNGPVFPASIRNNQKFQTASRQCQSLLAPPQGGAPSGA